MTVAQDARIVVLERDLERARETFASLDVHAANLIRTCSSLNAQYARDIAEIRAELDDVRKHAMMYEVCTAQLHAAACHSTN